MQVQLGSSRMGGTSLEAENINEHYKHAVACHTLCCTWTRCHAPQLVPGIYLRPGIYKLYSQAYPRRVNEAGVYSREASIRGNTVCILLSYGPKLTSLLPLWHDIKIYYLYSNHYRSLHIPGNMPKVDLPGNYINSSTVGLHTSGDSITARV